MGVNGKLGLALGALVILIGAYAFWPLREMPAWEEPATVQERKARDFAHSIVLPDSVPKPVPFNFALARLKALVPGLPSVSEQYFEHLCDTEAGQYIFKTVENVDGFLQMRPRRRYTDIEQMNPYLIESAVGLSAAGADQFYKEDGRASGAPMYFVQPMLGSYRFIEQPVGQTGGVVHFYRDATNPDPQIGSYQVQTANRATGRPVSVPFMIAYRLLDAPQSTFGYTWRGIRRDADRSLGISGGELIVLDLASRSPLAIFREFKRAFGKYPRWDTSKRCSGRNSDYSHLFVPQVLVPNPSVNDGIVQTK
jgi:hypothetical protein